MIINWVELNKGSLDGGVKSLRLDAEDFDDIVFLTGLTQAVRDGGVVKITALDGTEIALNKEKS